jgi:hypothetical protein
MNLRARRAGAALAAVGIGAATTVGLPSGALAKAGETAAPTPLLPSGAVAAPPVIGAAPAAILLSKHVGSIHAILSVHRPGLNVLGGHATTVVGVLRPALANRLVSLQVLSGRRWKGVAQTRTGAHGRYRFRYVPRRTVSELMRVYFGGDQGDSAAHRPVGRLNVYRLAGASWYGGGGGLACGGSLTNSTLGVANKTLPCGTLVTLRYHGNVVRVPVIDRGPYVAGRDFDLTEATKRALGFGDTGEVWSTR